MANCKDYGPATEHYFRAQDIATFKIAAKLNNLYIVVRRTNPESIQYVGKPGYTPKLLDCKAKTAKCDVTFNGRVYDTKGLVVDFDLFKNQLLEVFKTEKGVADAEDGWKKFMKTGHYAPPSFFGPDGLPEIRYNHNYAYFTDRDPKSKHFGCIKYSPTAPRGGNYVHGDYDLYALVAADAPNVNVFAQDKRLGQQHSRSIEHYKVMGYFSAQIPGMVGHGEQDTFKEDLDDKLDVFCPDGITVKPVLGRAAIEELYRTTFKGRRMFRPGIDKLDKIAGTDWYTFS